jgi:hypothetical protein
VKLKEIEFKGYKRLSATKCNVDGRTVAFIGPNEAGKSSILAGLQWLTEDSETELPANDVNRKSPPPATSSVVRVLFRIEPEDISELDALGLDTDVPISLKTVTGFYYGRSLDGTTRTEVVSTVRRNPRPLAAMEKARKSVTSLLSMVEDSIDPTTLESLHAALDELEGVELNSLSESVLASAGSTLSEAASDPSIKSAKAARNRKFAERLGQLNELVTALETSASKQDPLAAMRRALRMRVPKFVLFSDQDRALAAAYNLSDENVRNEPPAPLYNLLVVGGTNVDEFWQAVSSGVVANLRTLERRVNAILRERLQPMWTQSKLAIELTANLGGILEVNIAELDNPDFTVTPIAERSDGLRAFLALVCFLVAADLPTPPVLMVDEVERNLHYDAQADLIRVLTKDLRVHKVLYTTHSPGSLPLDLGTGIRVVSRDPEDVSASTLENNFWTDSEPGFSRLLFAMGAEVAAFSAFRRALLAEGVSEMMLLPTLMRNATNQSELDFQVAPGLSNMSAPSALGSVALITTFLVDGDAAGDIKRSQLELAGFPKSHIFALPKNKSIEDLVDRGTYLDEVDDFLVERGDPTLLRSAISAGVTIARAVDDYCMSEPNIGRDVSHKIIASRLAEYGVDLQLSPLGLRVLPALRDKIEAALANPYNLAAKDELQ